MGFKKLLAVLSIATSALAAHPVGSGRWTSVTANTTYSVQQCAGGVVDGDIFSLPASPNGSTSGSGCSNGHLRAERRYNNDYTSGVHQFGGNFQITSMTGSRVALKQTFNGNTGPYFLMAVKSNGDLYDVEGGGLIASGVATVGATVTLNTIHDADNQQYYVYVNGEQTFSTSAPGGSFYDKVGAYTTDSGTGAITVVWSDISFWIQ